MFRKGGNVGEGIMTGIVDREQYETGTDPFVGDTNQFAFNTPTYKGIDIPSLKDLTAEKKDALLEAAGDRGGFDPLTAFLLTYGPAAATQTGGGGTIGNLLAAGKKPIEKKSPIRKNAIPVQTPAKPKPASVPQILQPVEENPFSNYFG